eukprot:TRINITY_DN4589_c0_g1_i17.p2 TRINITY_DN4589_c0_g1~~TRINITY_DN4589_c0_g1_i17.p2  ORF type:complete len:203 (+),score=44.95 TRINITY_DN4589_c0_g1_i17:184-792(+)
MTNEERLRVASDQENSNKVTLFWQNLTARVPIKDKKVLASLEANGNAHEGKPLRTIMDGLSGVAHPNELVGLLGPSGSGKTILLNMFSSRLYLPPGSEYKRNVYVNRNQPLTRDLFGKIGAYVMQDDVLLETLTPYECLLFSANLRLSGTEEEKEARVNKVLEDLRLKGCKDTLVRLKENGRWGTCCRREYREERGSAHPSE